jgi:hypothetical protein
MEIEAKVQLNNLIRFRDDHLKWIECEIGDEIILRDDTNKKGQRYIAVWKKGK